MATTTAHHYATVNPYTGKVVREIDSGRELGAAGIEEFANRKLICAVAPHAPVGGFAG